MFNLVLLGKELAELLENLHVKLGGVPSPDHSGDLLVGASKLLQEDVEVQALLGVQKSDLLGLLPGWGHCLFLGLGHGEGEEPLDGGEVRLHHLSVRAAQ